METKRKPRGYWTLERCKEDAARFTSRWEWQKQHQAGYHAAQRNGWVNECCAHMEPIQRSWDLGSCKKDAARFESRHEWQLESSGGYYAAQRNGWLDECCAHMISSRRKSGHWTKARCLKDASGFCYRFQWQQESPSAYSAAKKKGWLDECCAHMVSPDVHFSSDNNVVYIWRDATTDLHKIGVTSDRIGEGRISSCGVSNNMDPRIVFMLKVSDARAVEAELLKLGTDPGLDSSIDGYTEFRVLTNEELGKAVSTAYQYAVAA